MWYLIVENQSKFPFAKIWDNWVRMELGTFICRTTYIMNRYLLVYTTTALKLDFIGGDDGEY